MRTQPAAAGQQLNAQWPTSCALRHPPSGRATRVSALDVRCSMFGLHRPTGSRGRAGFPLTPVLFPAMGRFEVGGSSAGERG
jgi:hypothetical protein